MEQGQRVFSGFRLPQEQHERLEKLIEYAYATGHISSKTVQDFLIFAMNCAGTYLKQYELERRRLR